MNTPRRWVDDPGADELLRDVLRGAPGTRPLDQMTRRRLASKVARASMLPAAAAGWLFVKSAAAALGVVLGTGAIAVSTGMIELSPAPPTEAAVAPKTFGTKPARRAAPPTAAAPEPEPEASPEPEAPTPALNPTPSLPIASTVPSSSSLAAEAALLERARGQMHAAPAAALAIAAEHANRFARGQLASERALIQIEALHRLGRDAEARQRASVLLGGSSAGLYRERIHQLLGEGFTP